MEPIGESLDKDLDPDFDFDQGRSCCTAATRRICTDVGSLKELQVLSAVLSDRAAVSGTID